MGARFSAVLSLCLLWLLALAPMRPVLAGEARSFDPSGQWKGMHGVLSLMASGNALSFAYSAVFGATAHLCDGAGTARHVGGNEYRHTDSQGVAAFRIRPQGVDMRIVDGIASFCGANWPGDAFSGDGFEPPARCAVASPRAVFHAVERIPPEPRKAYVVKGDLVETVPACFEGADAWVFARFTTPESEIVGLLRRDDLECP